MKKLINSSRMSWFRKSFLINIRKEIFNDDRYYCCHVDSWHSKFICWKDLKEVQENLNSEYIKFYVKEEKLYNCSEVWFYNKTKRLNFLDECIAKFKNY